MKNTKFKVITIFLILITSSVFADNKTTNFGIGLDLEDGSQYGYSFYSSLGGLDEADIGIIYYGFRF